MFKQNKLQTFKFIFIPFMVLALAGCSVIPAEEEPLAPPLLEPKKEEVRLLTVEKGSIVKNLNLQGNFRSSNMDSLYFKEHGGRITSIDVKLGDTVSRGDVVAQLENEELAKRVRQQILAVERSRIELEKAKQEVELDLPDTQNELDLKNIEASIEDAKMNLERTERLYEEGAVSLQELEAMQQQVEQLQFSYDKLLINTEGNKVYPQDDQLIRLLEINLETAQIELNYLQQQLSNTKLVAKMDGVVTYTNPLKLGEAVTAYDPIVEIANSDNLIVLARLDSQEEMIDAKDAEINQAVEIKYNNEVFTGTVVQTPETAPASTDREVTELNKSTIFVKPDEGLPEEIEIGDRVDVTITLIEKEDTIVIPSASLQTYLGRNYVKILDGESRIEVDVEVGIETKTEVEIISGIEEGQQLILN
ncbi:efflux RND transporter periplasmic adaptor subunit [Chengkuizengella axinellae]|uniref:HlyD family efflux transporter periplasmic adaptor subunit n=1 Tax=Chengkuizengella axinellae TaxID=3064388 RepID=A0ABT9J0T7_9BACL|nr:HlyD family efflux transporter periplasmic adaptor subunit [Chengkuizengella sp. 2205SS18-9]MDP5275027.1 HlyD family efflux transporter periplasmic adaptor subunit [Chengkuizengella sp. 2205SS18-9]